MCDVHECNVCKFCTRCILGQFALLEGIADVLADHRTFPAEQLRHPAAHPATPGHRGHGTGHLIENLLLRMVFCDQGHEVNPENLTVVAEPGMDAQGKALNTRSTAAQSVWGIEYRLRGDAIKKDSCPEREVAGELARGADTAVRLDQIGLNGG